MRHACVQIDLPNISRRCGTLRNMTRHPDVVSPSEKRDLCNRILSSKALPSRAPQAKQVIAFLFEMSIEGGEPQAKNVAEHMAEISPGLKLKSDQEQANAAAQVVRRVRKFFTRYYDENRGEKVRVDIPVGQYGLTFAFNTPAPQTRHLVREFWAPHVAAKGPITIIYTEPLFTRNEDFTEFRRQVDINSDATPIIGQMFCYSHVPLGEVVATIKLAKKFWEWDIDTTEYGARTNVPYDSYMKAPEGSFIVLGAPRANGFVSTLQRDAKLDIVVSDKEIILKRPLSSKKDSPSPKQPPFRESQTADTVVGYVVVTRLQKRGRWVTMFHGNHGQAISRLVEILLDEDETRKLYRAQIPELHGGFLPEYFQLLFRVEMDNRGESVPDVVSLVAKSPEPWPNQPESQSS